MSMRVLVYYSKGDNYKRIANSLSSENINPIILWAENFKEVNSDNGDAFYICDDVPENKRERIIKHFANRDIQMLEGIEAGAIAVDSDMDNESVHFETLEEVEKFINAVQLELEEAYKLRDKFLDDQKSAVEQEQRPEDARLAKEKADKEKREADEAAAKALKEQQESDEAAKEAEEKQALADETKTSEDRDDFFDEEPSTDGGDFKHPTKEQMVLELRELKEIENIEVEIPNKPTVAQLHPLYDKYIRKITPDIDSNGNG